MKRMILLVVTLILVTTAAFADIAPAPGKSPNRVKKPPVVNTNLDITLDSKATEARLIIPASQLKQLRAELDLLDGGDSNTAAVSTDATFTRTQTIVSGIFLSLAFVFGGIFFVRSGRNVRTVGAVVVAAAIGSAATVIYANVGPPLDARTISGKMFSQAVHNYGFGTGKIKLETGEGDRIKLIVPNPEKTPSGNE